MPFKLNSKYVTNIISVKRADGWKIVKTEITLLIKKAHFKNVSRIKGRGKFESCYLFLVLLLFDKKNNNEAVMMD